MSRLRAWGNTRAPEAGTPEVPARSVAPVEDPSPAAALPAGETDEPESGPDLLAREDEPEVVAAIRDELLVRRGELRALFARDGAADVTAILDGLTRPGAVVRQPPTAAQAVLALSRRRDFGLDEMTGHFERDPAMSQALLRHSNSAWYAGHAHQPILGLKAAIQRVGTKGVHATVMFHILQGGLSRPGGGMDLMAEQVWEHMVRTAPLARGMARFFRADPDEAFTLALLHDVGKLVFFDRVAEERKRLRRPVHFPEGFVTAALNLLHEPLGGLAAVEWGLDGRSARVIATHHRWGDHPVDEPLSQVVYLAEAVDLARQRGEDPDLDHLWAAGDLDGPMASVADWIAEDADALDETHRAHKRRIALSS